MIDTETNKELLNEYYNYQREYGAKYGFENTIIFMQEGKFYECYYYPNGIFKIDIHTIASIFNYRVVRKNKNLPISADNPLLVGTPECQLDNNVKRLIDNNYIVVIVQECGMNGKKKCREVVNVWSPGTYINNRDIPNNNNDSNYNYVISIYIEYFKQRNGKLLPIIGISAINITVGKIYVTEIYSSKRDDKTCFDELKSFIYTHYCKEILLVDNDDNNDKINEIKSDLKTEFPDILFNTTIAVNSKHHDKKFQDDFFNSIYKFDNELHSVECLNLEQYNQATISLLILLHFIKEHNSSLLATLNKPQIIPVDNYLSLGNNALYQLHIFENGVYDKYCNIKSLYDLINKTSNPIGARFLRHELCYPSIDPNILQSRYDCIEELLKIKCMDQIKTYLKFSDLEQLQRLLYIGTESLSTNSNKIRFAPKNLISLYNGLSNISDLIEYVNKLSIKSISINILPSNDIINQLIELIKYLENSIDFDKLNEYIQSGETKFYNIFHKLVDSKLDNLQHDCDDAIDKFDKIKDYILTLTNSNAKKEKPNIIDRSGVSIKIEENRYYKIQMTATKNRMLKSKLTEIFKHKKMVNKKIIIDDIVLDKIEINNLTKSDKKKYYFDHPYVTELSNNLAMTIKLLHHEVKLKYNQLITNIVDGYGQIFNPLVHFIELIDFLNSAAITAKSYNYTKPHISTNQNSDHSSLDCINLRHPIIEQIIGTPYVPHNIKIGFENELKGMLIFGINSAGKSSLMKAIGISIIMAQCGMYVAAETYKFSIYRKIYARITGNDNLFKGYSSFTLEMHELRSIIFRSDPYTLVIGDEICRGTEHVSAISIVLSSLIQLSKKQATFIFATHLHEIVKIPKFTQLSNIKCFYLKVAMDPIKDNLVFDRTLLEGCGEPIYGILVAKHIIQDDDFNNEAEEIKKYVLGNKSLTSITKTSKYNSKLYIIECELCGLSIEPNTTNVSYFDTHHINFQKDCDEDGFINKYKHIHKNHLSNLIVLCKQCHNKIHNEESIIINGYKSTIKGKQLDYEIIDNKLV